MAFYKLKRWLEGVVFEDIKVFEGNVQAVVTEIEAAKKVRKGHYIAELVSGCLSEERAEEDALFESMKKSAAPKSASRSKRTPLSRKKES